MQVHAHYHFRPVTALLSVNYMNRFLSFSSIPVQYVLSVSPRKIKENEATFHENNGFSGKKCLTFLFILVIITYLPFGVNLAATKWVGVSSTVTGLFVSSG